MYLMFLASKGLMVDSMAELSQEYRSELITKLRLVGLVFSANDFEDGYPLNFGHTDDSETLLDNLYIILHCAPIHPNVPSK